MSRTGVTGRGAVRSSVITGVIVSLLLLAGGVFYALTEKPTWTAESMLIVLPATELDDATSASYYETLSRGQIVATFAEVAGGQGVLQQAEDQLGLSPAQRATVSTQVTVVPDTAIILLRTSAADATVAQQVVQATTDLSTNYLATLSKYYRTVTVPRAEGQATSSGLSPTVVIAASIVVALIAGLAVQQAVYHLSAAIRRPRAVGGPSAVAGTVAEPVRTTTPAPPAADPVAAVADAPDDADLEASPRRAEPVEAARG